MGGKVFLKSLPHFASNIPSMLLPWMVNMSLKGDLVGFAFASFDAQKIIKLATFYPKDFESVDFIRLELQL
jgi:hypothetical protein